MKPSAASPILGRSALMDRSPASPDRLRRLLGWLCLLATVIAWWSAFAGPAGAAGSDYVLGPEDKIRVKVYEWRASIDQIFEWTALNDDFTVSADGTLSLPFIGEIPAAGYSPGELAPIIAERLRENMGLGRRPDTAVEVVKFRPFYIVGHVMQPGAFPYHPGLTVLKALSLAGGLRRQEQGWARLERDAIADRGDIALIRRERQALLARKARLEAELKVAEDVTFPPELTSAADDREIALLMEQEKLIFNARREAFDTQLHALDQLKVFLEQEVGSLGAQLETERTQIDIVQKELDGITKLVDKGLAVAPRQLSLERTMAQIEGDRLRAETSLLKAKQEIGRTDISIIELRNKRANEITVELRGTQAALEDNERKGKTAEQLLYEAEVIAPRNMLASTASEMAEPVFTIVRQKGGEAVEINASETTRVEPGDAVKVEIPRTPFRGMFDLSPEPASGPDRPSGGQQAQRTGLHR